MPGVAESCVRRLRHRIPRLRCCVAAVAANSPTPQQRYGAEMRIYLREGNVEKTIHYCKLLGEECVKTETIRKRAPYCRRLRTAPSCR